ncbi:MAG: hypothetical protein QXG35_01550 [Nitrososphaerota archaeon]
MRMGKSGKKVLRKYAAFLGGVVASLLSGGLAILPIMVLAAIRRSREEEVTFGANLIAGCLLAGVIMAVAKPLAFWVLGWTALNLDDKDGDKVPDPNEVYYLDQNGNNKYDQGEPAVPAPLVDMANRIFDLLMYFGVIMLVIGLIIAGISLVRKPGQGLMRKK